jgi:hypothetical protein
MKIAPNLACVSFVQRLAHRRVTVLAVLGALVVGVPFGRAQPNYATPYTFTTVAGTAYVPGSKDGTGSAARFYVPFGAATDSNGNVYVADEVNDTVRKISPASNTGWGTSANPAQIASVAAQVGAFAFAANSADSAQIVNLAAGPYTIQISGVNDTTGVALAEIYEVP